MRIFIIFQENEINVYGFPPLRENETAKDLDFVGRIPFAVVGSNVVLEVCLRITHFFFIGNSVA